VSKEQYVHRCPKCDGADIGWSFWGGTRYQCMSCDHHWSAWDIANSRIVAGDSVAKSKSDVPTSSAHPLCFPMQDISSASETSDSVAHHTTKQGVSVNLAKVDLL
jgi:hypothetical protein